ncbi:MAG: hypothetical protein B7Z40_00880 [Bosea sp. 12-68-7]|nr:MAG: hypothetical protein B7Z40_00880 [Bosea sp. 12-68-7]OYW98389.1 MAG: hypothetical protein B7Z14_14980 [Bosea sp. 32-68-6]
MTLEIADCRIDLAAERDGEWIDNVPDMPGLSLLVRGLECEAARSLRARRAATWARQVPDSIARDGPPASVSDRALTDSLIHIILRDWRGLAEDGVPLAYAPETASRLLADPSYRTFRIGVIWAAAQVGRTPAWRARQGEAA